MAEEYLYPEEIKRDGWSRYLKNQMSQPSKEPLFKKFMTEENYKKFKESLVDKDKYCDCHSKCFYCGRPYRPTYNLTFPPEGNYSL